MSDWKRPVRPLLWRSSPCAKRKLRCNCPSLLYSFLTKCWHFTLFSVLRFLGMPAMSCMFHQALCMDVLPTETPCSKGFREARCNVRQWLLLTSKSMLKWLQLAPLLVPLCLKAFY